MVKNYINTYTGIFVVCIVALLSGLVVPVANRITDQATDQVVDHDVTAKPENLAPDKTCSHGCFVDLTILEKENAELH